MAAPLPSHLTRHVFRRLLANKPIVHPGCLRRQAYGSAFCVQTASKPGRSLSGRVVMSKAQRRNFLNFNFFKRKEEGSKEADMDPGTEKMMELAKRQRMRARMPPVEEVAEALTSFFQTKRDKRQSITDTQAQLALQSLRYYIAACKESQEKEEAPKFDLSTAMLGLAADTLLQYAHVDALSAPHVELAQLLYETLAPSEDKAAFASSVYACICILSLTSSAEQARQLAFRHEESFAAITTKNIRPPRARKDIAGGHSQLDAKDGQVQQRTAGVTGGVWAAILRGFARENNAAEVHRTLSLIDERGFGNLAPIAGIMLDFCMELNDLAGVKQWWTSYRKVASQYPKTNDLEMYPDYAQNLDKVLKWCLVQNEMEFGHAVVKDVMTTNPRKPVWDAIFVWAAGTKKSVDEIDRMMSVMEASNESFSDRSKWRVPDITTINGLVELAVSRNDPYMAERFIALGRDRSIEPDARTYVLQMEYRLRVEDVDGALIAYKNLQAMDVSANEDVSAVNRLIVALCNTKRHDFDTIMNVTADLSDRRVRFDPGTVSTLALLHLNRDEHADVHDLLNTHAYHYSSAERESIRNAIIAFTVDPNTPVSRAWSGYSIIHSIFDETPRDQRTELMTAFFNRERADMGVRIFQNMRMHSRTDTIPTVDTYVAAFLGLAKLRDLESLEVIHNLLKLDYNITATTYLYNALIIAYTACGKARKALGFWDDIVASREGPSYNSIHIALRACEKSPFGDLKAKDVWSLLRRRTVELDHNMWCSYAGALSGNGDVDMAINTIEEAEGKSEVDIDAFLLGSLYEGAPGPTKKDEVESWARDRYSDEWAKLEAFGHELDEAGMKHFKIDRRVTP